MQKSLKVAVSIAVAVLATCVMPDPGLAATGESAAALPILGVISRFTSYVGYWAVGSFAVSVALALCFRDPAH